MPRAASPEPASDPERAIPVQLGYRPSPVVPGASAGHAAPDVGESGGVPRCLARPARLTLRQTNASNTADDKQDFLTVAHLNVRSIMPSLDDVKKLLTNHRIDVMCLGETWLTSDIRDSYLPWVFNDAL